jgi:hypothetical protein
MFNQTRIKELEMANQQWEQWYQTQQSPQFQPFQQVPPTTKKKKKKHIAKSRGTGAMSFEQKLWIAIIILSFFSVLIIKDWLTDIKTPDRVERKLKTK